MKSILLDHETIRKLKMYSASENSSIVEEVRKFANEKYSKLISEINKDSEVFVK